MQEGERAAMFDVAREGEGFLDAGQCPVRSKHFCFELRQQSVVEPQVDSNALFHESRQNPSNLGCATYRVIDPTPRPTGMQFGLVEVLHHPVLSRDRLKSNSRAQRRQRIASPDLQIRFKEERIGKTGNVTYL